LEETFVHAHQMFSANDSGENVMINHNESDLHRTLTFDLKINRGHLIIMNNLQKVDQRNFKLLGGQDFLVKARLNLTFD
jgi:hypothetical protein